MYLLLMIFLLRLGKAVGEGVGRKEDMGCKMGLRRGMVRGLGLMRILIEGLSAYIGWE
jgi:hypothetical protein